MGRPTEAVRLMADQGDGKRPHDTEAASTPGVTVSIVTWNSARYLPACIDRLLSQTLNSMELVFVDNGSMDGSLEIVRARLPDAQIIQNERNEGYCRAHNQAIKASRCDFFLPLNPDVMMSPDFISRLVSALDSRPEFGSAAGKMWQPGEENPPLLDAAGLFLDRRRHQYLRGRGEHDRGQYDTAEEVFGADGAAPLYRRRMLEDVKVFEEYFDEAFFAYMDDVDLAWRARLMGWKCWYEPSATAFHVRTFQPGRRRDRPPGLRRMGVRNRYLMLLKNEGREEFRRDWWRILAFDLGVWAYILLLEQSSLGALAQLRRAWPGARSWRREIWGRARASAEERLGWLG